MAKPLGSVAAASIVSLVDDAQPQFFPSIPFTRRKCCRAGAGTIAPTDGRLWPRKPRSPSRLRCPRAINEDVPCAICKTAKAKRFCPGIREDICTACCGVGRERTIDCPLTCEYLAEAHRHEKQLPADPDAMPGKDIPIDEDFLHTNQYLIVLLTSAMFGGAKSHANALDSDAVTALESLVTTYRTLNSGLFYEAKPVNPIAADMFDAVNVCVEDIRRREAESGPQLPDSVVLNVLVFLQRMAFGLNNGRPKCKAFLVFLSQFYTDLRQAEEEVAEEPKVIL